MDLQQALSEIQEVEHQRDYFQLQVKVLYIYEARSVN
jgi:hypothetical protein